MTRAQRKAFEDVITKNSELRTAIRELLALIDMREGHGTPTFSQDRCAIYYAVGIAEAAINAQTPHPPPASAL